MNSADSLVTYGSDAQTRVVINTADAAEMTKLYGINPVLAARIVAFREETGPFHGPSDLALVDGLGSELSYVLAPHIDWRHEQAVSSEVGRSILVFIVCLIGFALSVVGISVGVYEMVAAAPYHNGLWEVIRNSSMLALLAWLAPIFALGSGVAITRSRRRRGTVIRLMVWPVLGFVITLVTAVTLATVNEPDMWFDLFVSPGDWLTVLPGVLVIAGLSIFVLIGFYPRLAINRLIAGTLDAICVLLGPALASFVWIERTDFPLVASLGWSVAGLGCVNLGVKVLRGFSLAKAISRHVSATQFDVGAESIWLRWINSHLPDPGQQKALLDALQQVHPPSRWRTLRSLVITGAGTWILAATASAIWEWIVQNWLDSGFGGP